MFRQENSLSEDSSSDEMADVCCGDSSEQQKQLDAVVPDAPAFNPTSALSTSDIVQDSNCIGTGSSDRDITPEQIERCSRQGCGLDTPTASRMHVFDRTTRGIIAALRAQLEDIPKTETKTETAPFCFAPVDRQPDLQIAKSYFIITLCDALNIDQSELRNRIRTLVPADARNVILEAVAMKPRMTNPRILDPEEREFILTKFIVELNISWNIASMFRRRTLSRELFIAMTQHARPKDVQSAPSKDVPTLEKSTDARRVTTGIEFLPGVYTRCEKQKITNPAEDRSIRVTRGDDPKPNPEFVEQSNKSVEYDEMLRTGMNAYAGLKALGHLPLNSDGLPVLWPVFWQAYKTGQKARDVAERARQWPTGKDICSLPSLNECLGPSFESCRPTFTHLSPVDPVTGKRTQLNKPREFTTPRPNAQIFRAEPAMRDTESKPCDFDFGSSIQDTIRRGIDSAAKYCGPIVSHSSSSIADSWNRGTLFPEAANVSLNTFANQIGSAMRVLPFPPKEVTFSMTLKA